MKNHREAGEAEHNMKKGEVAWKREKQQTRPTLLTSGRAHGYCKSPKLILLKTGFLPCRPARVGEEILP